MGNHRAIVTDAPTVAIPRQQMKQAMAKFKADRPPSFREAMGPQWAELRSAGRDVHQVAVALNAKKSKPYREKRVSHLLHLVLTAVTFGGWAPVWGVVTVHDRAKRSK